MEYFRNRIDMYLFSVQITLFQRISVELFMYFCTIQYSLDHHWNEYISFIRYSLDTCVPFNFHLVVIGMNETWAWFINLCHLSLCHSLGNCNQGLVLQGVSLLPSLIPSKGCIFSLVENTFGWVCLVATCQVALILVL